MGYPDGKTSGGKCLTPDQFVAASAMGLIQGGGGANTVEYSTRKGGN